MFSLSCLETEKIKVLRVLSKCVGCQGKIQSPNKSFVNTENIKVLRVLEVGQINRQRLPGYIGQTENDEAFTHKVLIKRV